MIHRSPLPRESLMELARKVALTVVYGGVVLLPLVPHALFSGVRRIGIGPLDERFVGLTLHANLLSIIAVVAIVLSVRSRYRYVHIPVCLLSLASTLSTVALEDPPVDVSGSRRDVIGKMAACAPPPCRTELLRELAVRQDRL